MYTYGVLYLQTSGRMIVNWILSFSCLSFDEVISASSSLLHPFLLLGVYLCDIITEYSVMDVGSFFSHDDEEGGAAHGSTKGPG